MSEPNEKSEDETASDRAARLRISDAAELMIKIETVGNSLVIPFVVISVPLLTVSFSTDTIFESYRYSAMTVGAIVSALWFLANQKLVRKVSLCQKIIREQPLLQPSSVAQQVERDIRSSIWRALPESSNLRAALYLIGVCAYGYAWGINDETRAQALSTPSVLGGSTNQVGQVES